MAPALPLKSFVLFIATGFLVFILIFIFVKRQLYRFALKSSHLPHAPITSGVPKALKHEIERRLRRTGDIKYEPRLKHSDNDAVPPIYFDQNVYHSHYRMKAVDAVKLIEEELRLYDPNLRSSPGSSLRSFLKGQLGEALQGVDWNTIERLCEMYDHARHQTLEFRKAQFDEFYDIVQRLITHIRDKIIMGANKKTFPLRVGESVFYCSQNTEGADSENEPGSGVRFRPTTGGESSPMNLKGLSSKQTAIVSTTVTGIELAKEVTEERLSV